MQLPTPESAAAEPSWRGPNPGEYRANSAKAFAVFVLKTRRGKKPEEKALVMSDQMEKEAVLQILNILLPPSSKYI